MDSTGGFPRRLVYRAGLMLNAQVSQRMMQCIRENRDVNLVFYDYSRFGRKCAASVTGV